MLIVIGKTDMRRAILAALFLCVMVVSWASPSAAGPTPERLKLRLDPFIQHSLVSAAVGALIVENCPKIRPRMFVAFQKAMALKKYALSLGVPDEEIDAFISSSWEKQRVRKAAEAYMQANGVIEGEPATYCALGHLEIQKGSLIGQLLRAD